MQMEAGKTLSDVQIESHNGEILSSQDAFKGKPTVIYFWSQSQMNHYKRTQERVKIYQKNHPNYRFVGMHSTLQ